MSGRLAAKFKKRSKELGATVVEVPAQITGMEKPEDRLFASAFSGGCGEPRCRCSPGLWITLIESGKCYTAHFGTNWKRGQDGDFTEDEHKNWITMRNEFRLETA